METKQAGLLVLGAAVISVTAFVLGAGYSQRETRPGLSDGESSALAAVETSEHPVTDFGTIIRERSATSPWEYRSIRDPLTGRMGTMACTRSNEMVRLRYPYDSHRALLCVRSSPRFGEDVFVALPQGGQFVCSDGCAVQVRVGSGQPAVVEATEPEDRSVANVFLNDSAAQDVIRSLHSASDAAVEVEIFESGPQTMVFPTSGFDWPPENLPDATRP